MGAVTYPDIQPKIDVRIPHEPHGRLGQDCNRILSESVHDWILFLDADIFLTCNRNWYFLCQTAINQHPEAGAFTCFTNKIYCADQRHKDAPKGRDLDAHKKFAKRVFDERSTTVSEIDLDIGGYFMLVNKTAALSVGGFPGLGQFDEDTALSQRLRAGGHKIYRINGLYVFHDQDKKQGSWIDEDVTAKEIREAYYADRVHG